MVNGLKAYNHIWLKFQLGNHVYQIRFIIIVFWISLFSIVSVFYLTVNVYSVNFAIDCAYFMRLKNLITRPGDYTVKEVKTQAEPKKACYHYVCNTCMPGTNVSKT